MSLEKSLMVFAGSMILLSVILTSFVHSAFIWFTVFIGLNMIQSSFTGFCPAAMVMKKMGIKTEVENIAFNRANI